MLAEIVKFCKTALSTPATRRERRDGAESLPLVVERKTVSLHIERACCDSQEVDTFRFSGPGGTEFITFALNI